MSKQTHIRIATWNTRGLLKLTTAPASSTTAKQVSTFIRSQELAADIFCLQEIKLASANSLSEDLLHRLHLSYQQFSHFFTKHVGIVILNKHLEVQDAFVSLDQRIMVVKVYHRQTQQSLTVVNVYGPSAAPMDVKCQFFENLYSLPPFSDGSINNESIVCGDFNLRLYDPNPPKWQRHWTLRLHALMVDSASHAGDVTREAGGSSSCIDYLFVSKNLAHRTANPCNWSLPSSRSDHHLLACDIVTPRTDIGRGAWRFNSCGICPS
ncbi:DNase I-like protein [Hesseltinella vesiculosa]|uniref:DNase I-like protein n=1 Tax=Hesseltinella vesiculosa TaxID=101127 RepID=A0A1X2GLI7_9FUNG|nr:DNase I-like protein [Hesseltinella vesiculosa]